MADLVECEIYLAMNEDGDWIVTTEESDAITELGENAGGSHARVVKVVVKMRAPVMTEAAVTVADEAGQTVEMEA